MTPRFHRRAAAFLLMAASAACGGEKPDPVQDALARERAAAHFRVRNDLARAEIAPLVARKKALASDLVLAAVIELLDGKMAECKALLARASSADPRSASAAYVLGQIAMQDGDFAGALPHFEKAHQLAPGDLPTRLSLGQALFEAGDEKRAEALYRSVVDVGLPNGQIWYATAIFRMARLLTIAGREEEAEPLNEIWASLEKRGALAPDFVQMSQGELAKVRAPKPTGSSVPQPSAPKFRAPEKILPELAGARMLEARDIDGDQRPDLLAVGDSWVRVALRDKDAWRVSTVAEGPVSLARAFDVDNDGDLDVLVLLGGKLALHLYDSQGWMPSTATFPELPGSPRDIVPVDYDHEGDVDLLLVGDFGARVWSNDGAGTPPEPGKPHGFADVSDVATLPRDRAFTWAITEDFDGDNDVDFLLGDEKDVYLADSLRAGRFVDASSSIEKRSGWVSAPAVADYDGDGRPEIGESWPIQIDLDLDGSLDLVQGQLGSAAARLAARTGVEKQITLAGSGAPACADLDGDRTIDLAFAAADGVELRRGEPTGNRAALLVFGGLRNNRRALGSIVEYRAGPIYRRIYWRGEPVLAGVGPADRIDVLRITWPNGVVQTNLDVDLGSPGGVDDPDAAFRGITEYEAQFGSCPFLYSNDGEKVVFVSDVLGGTPLGLPAKPGVLVPFRHEEYVLVRGDQLAPKDGVLELHLTEELREVTYLDAARLIAVDHPAGTRIYPNELFCFPPFPEHRLHAVADSIAPARATGSDGREWAEELADVDDRHAAPFVLEAKQFAGRAKPWYVELAFDPAAVARAQKLRLVMTGWVYWSDATANMASAGEGLEFVPPTLEIPDGNGGWKVAGPPVGFPSGKTKTMVVDVGSILRRDDPRIRLATNLRLYWDQIALALDADDATRETREAGVASARIWGRGFSAPLEATPHDDGGARPERFDWNVLAKQARWNQTPGLYTRYGDCTELCTAVDDRYAMVGAGDALTLRFDAALFPPPREGLVRDWILHLDGWCKDADPHTLASGTVEPLPFHGMSAYPYPATESFPDDAAHRAWRARWNTRPATQWIPPLVLNLGE
ncbi:MAG: FG-GAP-like repeat-containing protein [Planctomycetota bacterium]